MSLVQFGEAATILSSAEAAQNHQLAQPCSQALPVRVLQATESWVVPGNEATARTVEGHNAENMYKFSRLEANKRKWN